VSLVCDSESESGSGSQYLSQVGRSSVSGRHRQNEIVDLSFSFCGAKLKKVNRKYYAPTCHSN
jgi:hypothetical protein